MAQTLPAGVTAVTSVEGIDEYRLPNGLQVLLVPDDSKPTTTVNLTYRVGSRHESYGETGMAHLLEHMIFKGTPTTLDPKAELSQRGLQYNGSTSFDRTNYFASFAANDANLKWYLGWEADAMIHSFVARKDLDTEMTVVRNEMESGENSPGRILGQRMLALMFDWHNYAHAPIGARSDVENVDIPSLQAFYRRYYQPDNATIIVSGKFEPAKALAWISESFGAIPKPTRVLPKLYTLEPVQDGERSICAQTGGRCAAGSGGAITFLPVRLGLTTRRWSCWPSSSAIRLRGVSTRGSRRSSSRRERRRRLVRPGRPWSLLRRVRNWPRGRISTRRAARCWPPSSPLPRRSRSRPTNLTRAKLKWLKDWDQSFTNPETCRHRRYRSPIAQGDWRLFFLTRDRVRAMRSVEDVQRVAEQYLLPDNRTLATYVPTDKPLRSHPPPARVDMAQAHEAISSRKQQPRR